MTITGPTCECDGAALLPVEVELCSVYGYRVDNSAESGVARLFVSVDPRRLASDGRGASYLVLGEALDQGHAMSMHYIRVDAAKEKAATASVSVESTPTAAADPLDEGQMSKEDLLATQARLWQEEARRHAKNAGYWRDRAETAEARRFDVEGAPRKLTESTLAALRPFEYSHLVGLPREVSSRFCTLAHQLLDVLAEGPELTLALRELRRAKDSAVMQAVITAESS